MMTGMHRVSDIHCKACMKLLGWTYVGPFSYSRLKIYAYEQSEKYKEGKFIIERACALKLKYSNKDQPGKVSDTSNSSRP